MLIHLLGLSLLACVGTAAYFLLRYPHRGLPSVIDVNELGRIEGGLDGLREVIVLADHIEPPTDDLRKAVERNFERGVKYSFVVSQSRAEQEVDSYYRIFEALAEIVSRRSGAKVGARDLVSIQQLPYDWIDEPHVFYKIPDRRRPGEMRYIAVQGNQRSEGIADYYRVVEPARAHMIARGIMSDAPGSITVSRAEVAESNVLEFKDRLHKQP